MSKYLILILWCLSALSSSTSDEVPTIAISCGNTRLENLPIYQQSMDTIGFKQILMSLWDEDTKVIMVLENELSLEDFTMKGNIISQTYLVFSILKIAQLIRHHVNISLILFLNISDL